MFTNDEIRKPDLNKSIPNQPSSPGTKLGRVNYETPTLFDQTMIPDKVLSIDDEIKKNELMI
jgi:hypothetical protein